GVIIPRANVENLMLKEEVAQAVAEGRFHVWAVDRVDEGIEILTGVPAGRPGRGGRYRENSVFGLVGRRLVEMAAQQVGSSRWVTRGRKTPRRPNAPRCPASRRCRTAPERKPAALPRARCGAPCGKNKNAPLQGRLLLHKPPRCAACEPSAAASGTRRHGD